MKKRETMKSQADREKEEREQMEAASKRSAERNATVRVWTFDRFKELGFEDYQAVLLAEWKADHHQVKAWLAAGATHMNVCDILRSDDADDEPVLTGVKDPQVQSLAPGFDLDR